MFEGTGVYPIKIRTIGFTGRVFIDVCGNPTIEDKARELLRNCNNSIQKYCSLDEDIIEYFVTTTAGDIWVSNGIHFYLGTWDKEPVYTIWDIVSNETYRNRLDVCLDLIADAFSEVAGELGIDYYGIRSSAGENTYIAVDVKPPISLWVISFTR